MLLDNNLVFHVCDFGFATITGHRPRLVSGLAQPRAAGLTPNYASPELFSRAFLGRAVSSETDKSSDVYSYAVLLYETVTQVKAWAGKSDEQIEHAVVHGDRPAVPDEVAYKYQPAPYNRIIPLMQRCWDPSPGARPSFLEIHSEFHKG